MRLLILPGVVATNLSGPAPAAERAGATFPFGVAWYPEWVPEASWDADLAAMRRANITMVRMAEFAWARLEPKEGRYDFGWLDRAVAAAERHGIKVVLGTPTAAPPIWLTAKYPEVLAVEADGRRTRHGWRRHFAVGSATYRSKAAAIAGEFGRRYGRSPAVLGFQIDNEYGRETYDPETRAGFQRWLAAKYGTVQRMNAAHFNVYWSLDYNHWDQVPIPAPAKDSPGLQLDWLRYFGEAWRSYQQVQIDALRPVMASDKFITTNFVAKYDEFDFSDPAQPLDVVGWDWYYEEAKFDPGEGAMLHDLYRGFKNRNPWVLETAPGTINWSTRNYAQPQGLVRAMFWQAVGHGADGYAFWQWQPPANGNETLHGTLVDAAGRPRPVLAEIARAGGEIARAWPFVRGSTPANDVALLHDYPSRWMIKRQPMTIDYDPWRLLVDFRRALMPVTNGVDVLRGLGGLDRYRLVVAPNLHLLSAAEGERLDRYVRAGGHLVLGPRSGQRDETNALWPISPVERLSGTRVEQGLVLPQRVGLGGTLGTGAATIWAEQLSPTQPEIETLLVHAPDRGWLSASPAVTTRRVGKGRVTYVGAWLDPATMARLLAWTAAQAKIAPVWPGRPAGVEVASRQGPRGRIHVVINWTDGPVEVRLPHAMWDILRGGARQTDKLAAGELTVLSEQGAVG